MIYQILNRIRVHRDLIAKHRAGGASDSELENHLLDEIAFFQESSIEEKLNHDIEEQERKLAQSLATIEALVSTHNIDRKALENTIYSELHSMFFEYM